jgi:hypothetical protein
LLSSSIDRQNICGERIDLDKLRMMNLFQVIQALNALGTSIDQEWQIIVRAPIAALLIAAIVSFLTWIITWAFFYRKLTSNRSLLETLESTVRTTEEEQFERNVDPVEWFRTEAIKEIHRIRRNPFHPYKKAEKSGVTLMNRMQLIAHVHEYGIKHDQRDAICERENKDVSPVNGGESEPLPRTM